MINYLVGKIVDFAKIQNNRMYLILEVNSIGYELQIPHRFARELQQNDGETVTIFTHLQIREEQPILYGFSSTAERDLFRQLIAVTGIGNQSALALIDTLGLSDLVQAIVTSNIKILTKTPGVGQKTAERIALELKVKLSQWREATGLVSKASPVMIPMSVLEDVEMTLLAVGYTEEEINQALTALSQDQQLIKINQPEEWIRRAIAWLS